MVSPRFVGILTLPFNGNYGGMIQAVALAHILTTLGARPVLIRKLPWRSRFGRGILWLLQRLPGHDLRGIRSRRKQRNRRDHELSRLIPAVTPYMRDPAQMARLVAGFDAVVTGSDQVWRRDYLNDAQFTNYFLDFVPEGVRRIAYAASFGHSDWRLPDLTARVSDLLARFDAVLVREQSGVTLCREVLGRADATLVLDPTLLPEPAWYEALIPGLSDTAPAGPVLLKYGLDDSPAMAVAEAGLRRENAALQVRRIGDGQDNPEALPLVEWLRAFRDADHILTDSFHGTVFAIIFRKNFHVFANRARGFDRFATLLGLLGLEDRLVPAEGPVPELPPIDYAAILPKLEALRLHSLALLRGALLPDRGEGA